MKKAVLFLLVLLLLPLGAFAQSADDFVVSDEVEETDKIYFWARMIMADMSLEEKVAQLFVVCPEDLTDEDYTLSATEALKTALKKYPVGGVLLFGQNIASGEQLLTLNQNMQEIARDPHGISLLIIGEEEGGRVSRIAQKLGLHSTDSMAVLGAQNDEMEAYRHGSSMAKILKEYGFNMNLAPVADVLLDEDNTDIGDRSFGSDAPKVSRMAVNVMKGLQDEGVIAAMKHFPGHGAVDGNTHSGVNNINRSLDEMRSCEFVPYVDGIREGLRAIVVSNLIARKMDGEYPAALSRAVVTDVLREELGFEGVVITDSLRQSVITDHFRSSKAAKLAVEAGADMLLLPEDFSDAYDGLLEAVRSGEVSIERIEESVLRILMLKIEYGLIVQ